MNRLNTLISNMLNSIPLPSLRGRGVVCSGGYGILAVASAIAVYRRGYDVLLAS